MKSPLRGPKFGTFVMSVMSVFAWAAKRSLNAMDVEDGVAMPALSRDACEAVENTYEGEQSDIEVRISVRITFACS